MSSPSEIYKQMLIMKLREKLKEKSIDSVTVLTKEAVESEKELLFNETDQILKEIKDYFEILDSLILSNDEEYEDVGAYLLSNLRPKH